MRLVISAVNFTEGGPLKILEDAVATAIETLPEWEIILLVNRFGIINNETVRQIAIPQCKKSWFKRIWFEWIGFMRLSKSIQPDLWLSLHDITPRVIARRQAVYCHNPSPFYRLRLGDVFRDPTFVIFRFFYGHIYRAFISRNHTVVVQQAWLREAFRCLYSHPNIVVAYPSRRDFALKMQSRVLNAMNPATTSRPLVLLYPALPRVFKNIEVLCNALMLLSPEIVSVLELRLTLSGVENAYARYLYNKFSFVQGVRFIGKQTREQMEEQYRECDVVLFPSKLETWGLPITEAKTRGIPIVVADLPYAHETVGSCDAITFLPAEDPNAWAFAIHNMALGQHKFGCNDRTIPAAPFAEDWAQLWRLLTQGL